MMARNQRRHGAHDCPVRIAVQWATDTAFDLWQLVHPVKCQRVTTRTGQHWQRPPERWIKCNVDASFPDGVCTGATGMVLRDYEGRSCGGKAKWYDHCLNALTAEALACRDGRTATSTGQRGALPDRGVGLSSASESLEQSVTAEIGD